MAPKNKGKGKSKEDDGSSGSAGKLKPAQSINVRHILVSLSLLGGYHISDDDRSTKSDSLIFIQCKV